MSDVFVIMPFGTKMSSTEDHKRPTIDFDFVYKRIIKQACENVELSVLRIDEMSSFGIISDQYLKAIIEAKIAICDVSLPNGNVYYELGIRQAISPSRTILIAHEGTRLPFDISHQRVFFYNLIDDVTDFIKILENNLKVYKIDSSENPVREYLEKIGFTSSPDKNKVSFEQELNSRIERAKNSDQLIGVWSWVKAFDPLPLFPLLRLAERLGEFENWIVSTDILEYLIQRHKNDYELYRLLGYHLRKQGGANEQKALIYLERALELNPADPESLGIIGGIYKRQRNYKKAKEYYTKGIEISTQNLYMKVTHAAMTYLEDPGQKEIALDRYRSLIRDIQGSTIITPLDSWSEVVLAEAFFAMGDIEQSKKHFSAAVKSDGNVAAKSALEQILLLAENGLNPGIADELKLWLEQELETEGSLKEKLETKNQPVNDKLPVVIHLTDVHFGSITKNEKQVTMHRFKDGDYTQTLSEHLKDEFNYFKYDSDRLFLVVSGDFTYCGRKGEFDSALKFVNDVCTFLKIEKRKVIFTPGNHDIDWHSSKADITNRFDNYISFLFRFYGPDLFREVYAEIKWDLSIHSSRPDPEKIMTVQIFKENKMVFVSLNSCMYETDQNHYGFIGGKQFRTVLKAFEEMGVDDSFIKIAVTHHHLLPHPIAVNNSGGAWIDLSIVRDSGLVEYKLENMGFDIVLHGHKHVPQLRETIVRDKYNNKYDKRLIVCGGGSCGVDASELDHNQANHYQVLEFLSSPRVKNTAFVKLIWRELEVHDGSEWNTSMSVVLNG